MFGDDLADLRVAEIDADLPADFGMMAAGFDAQGLGNIVEQGAGNGLLPVWQGAGAFRRSCQAVDQCSGNPGDQDGMVADIFEHRILIEITADTG